MTNSKAYSQSLFLPHWEGRLFGLKSLIYKPGFVPELLIYNRIKHYGPSRDSRNCFLSFLFLFFCLFRDRVSLWSSGYSLLYRSGWSRTQKMACHCFPSAWIESVHHHCPAFFFKSRFFKIIFLLNIIFITLPNVKPLLIFPILPPASTYMLLHTAHFQLLSLINN